MPDRLTEADVGTPSTVGMAGCGEFGVVCSTMSPMKGAAGPVVVMVRLHPPLMLPPEPELSSTTYKDQTPLADCPLNVAKVVPYGAAGAGEANVSPPPMLVGL